MSTISDFEKIKCTGCRSCEQSCPKKSITMKEDKEGFFYPEINDSCVNCGLCVTHCPILSPVSSSKIEPKAFSMILKDSQLLTKSSSGGVFAGIADYFLDNGGVVYGCAYDENFTAEIIRITEKSDLNKLQGSKYVSSNTQNTYVQVKQDLNNNLKVLYTGLPCQIAGLKAFLGKEYDNLYTIDLFCHGTPSQKLFSKYINWKTAKLKEKIVYYGFRDKDAGGWNCGSKIKADTKTRTYVVDAKFDPYYSAFIRNEDFRESCYICPFAAKERIGDVSIGDFWGVELFFPDLDRTKGVSAILINSEKGDSLINSVKSLFNVYETTYANVAEKNPNVWRPTIRSEKRDTIYKNIDVFSDNKYFSTFKYEKSVLFYNIKRFIRRVLRKIKRTLLIKK